MTKRTKIDVYAETLSMEFGDTFVQFNIFEALKHLAKDHSIFNIDTIDGLVQEHMRMGTGSANMIDEVLEYPQYAQFSIADTNKPGVTRVATIVIDKFDSKNKVRKTKRAESDSKGKKKIESDSKGTEEGKTNSNM
ncbi:hypothetical protein CR513_61705, partial [Mucuna pruriens]